MASAKTAVLDLVFLAIHPWEDYLHLIWQWKQGMRKMFS